MGKQRLVEKKCRAIDRLSGLRVMAAWTTGEHHVAECAVDDGRWAYVNYKTGAVDWIEPSLPFNPVPWWREGWGPMPGEDRVTYNQRVAGMRAGRTGALAELVTEALIPGVISADNTLLKAVPTPFEGTGDAIGLGGPISFKEDA